MKEHRLPILVSALLVVACGLGEVIPPAVESLEPTAAYEQTPTLPSPASTPQAGPSSIASNFPSLVWLPFAHSSESHGGKVLAVRAGQGAFEPAPVAIGMFWDYTSLTGRIAYASHFWQPDGGTSASDLWVYDYASGKLEMWQAGHVVNAVWSPARDLGVSGQYLAAALSDGSLLLFTAPGQFRMLASDASSHFSWSPDGRSLAYLKDGGLFMIPVEGGEPRQLTKVVTQNTGGIGWTGDKPIWAIEAQSIIYTKEPFEIVRLDNSEAFVPRTADGKLPEGERAFHMLWSPEKRILVVETEETNSFRVWIYELSPDLRTITKSDSFERFESEPVAAWWVPGESILLRNGEVWSIAERAVILTIR